MTTPLKWTYLCVVCVACAAARPPASVAPAQTPSTTSPVALLDVEATLEKRPFSATPTELLALGGQAQGEASAVVILYEERRYVFDAQGRQAVRDYAIYKVLTQVGVDRWNSLGTQWEPWHEKEPQLRARVVNPQGQAFEIDPATIERTAGAGAAHEIYSDTQNKRAPLPGLCVGAVVEHEIVREETAPLFAAGGGETFYFSSDVPVNRSRLVIDAPVDLQLKISPRGQNVPVARARRIGGRMITEYVSGVSNGTINAPPGLPYDVSPVPAIGITTGASWSAVATAYNKAVEAKLVGADVSLLLTDVKPGAKAPQTIAPVLQALHKHIRYTGIEFGESSLIPHTPSQTLQRRFGDCKDKAAVLVAALRKLGMKAHLALLRAGHGLDVDPLLPGVGRFNHAIVYVAKPTPLWIDATAAYMAVGHLPRSVQGRKALVIDDDTTQLVTVPVLPASTSRGEEHRTIWLSEYWPSRLEEVTLAHGAEAADLRSWYDGADAKKTREAFGEYVKSAYKATSLINYTTSDPKNVDAPFQLKVDATDLAYATVNYDEASVEVPVRSLLEWLPAELEDVSDLGDENNGDGTSLARRDADYQFYRPYVYDIFTKIVPPLGYVPRSLPEAKTWKLQTMLVEETSTAQSDGSVVVHHHLDTGPNRITAEQYLSLRKDLRGFYESRNPVVHFVHQGEALVSAGHWAQGIATLRALIGQNPNDVRLRARLANALLMAGLMGSARREINEALKKFGDAPILLQAKGKILQYGYDGVRFGRGSDY